MRVGNAVTWTTSVDGRHPPRDHAACEAPAREGEELRLVWPEGDYGMTVEMPVSRWWPGPTGQLAAGR
jgi:hypothetical protein